MAVQLLIVSLHVPALPGSTVQHWQAGSAPWPAPLLLRIDEVGDDLAATSTELFVSPEAQAAMSAFLTA